MVKKITQARLDQYRRNGWKVELQQGSYYLLHKKIDACACCLNTTLYGLTAPCICISSIVSALPACFINLITEYARGASPKDINCWSYRLYQVNELACDYLAPCVHDQLIKVEVVRSEKDRLNRPSSAPPALLSV